MSYVKERKENSNYRNTRSRQDTRKANIEAILINTNKMGSRLGILRSTDFKYNRRRQTRHYDPNVNNIA